MSELDCNTLKGREAIKRQHDIGRTSARVWGTTYTSTDDTQAEPVDGLFHKGEPLVACAEIKARDLTLEGLRTFGSYLITDQHLRDAADYARRHGVPLLVVVGLYPEKRIVWWKVTEPDGRWLIQPLTRRTKTQATVNGGEAWRVNAFIPLNDMRLMDASIEGDDIVDVDDDLRDVGRKAFGIVYP